MNSRLWLFFIFTICSLVLIYSRHMVVRSSYQLQEIEKSNLELREKNLELQAEYNTLISPSRLNGLAAMYGLPEERPGQIIYLREE